MTRTRKRARREMKGTGKRSGFDDPLPRAVNLLLFQEFQNFRRMRGRIGDRDPVLLDRTVRPDQRRGTDRPLNGLALSVFPWPPGAVGFHHGDLRVGQQRERQVELGDELIVRIDAVSADSENDCVGLCYGLNSVAEPARFLGSARRIVLRIKPKHYVFPGVVGQRMLLAIAAFQGKRRSLLSFKTCHCDTSFLSVSSVYHTHQLSINPVETSRSPTNRLP